LRGHFRPEWLELLDNGHATAPALKDWLDGLSRQALVDYLKKY
jgi:hypothetical protein